MIHSLLSRLVLFSVVLLAFLLTDSPLICAQTKLKVSSESIFYEIVDFDSKSTTTDFAASLFSSTKADLDNSDQINLATSNASAFLSADGEVRLRSSSTAHGENGVDFYWGDATSTARSITTWETFSSSLAVGADFKLEITIPMSGQMTATQNIESNLLDSNSSAGASAWLLFGNDSVYSGSASVYDPTSGGNNSVFSAEGDWIEKFVQYGNPNDPDPNTSDSFAIADDFTITVDASIGTDFNVEFGLTTWASITSAEAMYAGADFGNTGIYSLRALDATTLNPIDVSFQAVVAVPEPASGVLVWAGLMLFAGTRRKRTA